ncbi:MAG: hypothetical protein FWC01_08145 [Treponema sp.]|nr:hypothetical protein [Treponema sp.]MCL2238084.1 hypothetical protein [Treponema sp.]
MKKGFFFSVVLLFVLIGGCVTIKSDSAIVYDETVPEDLRTVITLPSYIRITKFNNIDVEWTGGNPLLMGTMSYAIPPGKNTFTVDYDQPGVSDPMARMRLMNRRYEVDMQPGQSYYIRGDSQGNVLFDLVSTNPPSGENNWWLFWNYDELKDEWGEKTGKHQMIFKNDIEGTFTKTIGSSPATSSRAMNIRNFAINESEMIFNIVEPGSVGYVLLVGNFNNMTVNTVVRTASLGERTISGRLTSTNRLVFPLNAQLREVLSQEADINFRITITFENSRANYTFTFKPEYFNMANTRLVSLNN